MRMRRVQIAGLILALLAAPLALMAGAQAGAAQECAMACCRGRRVNAAQMKCGNAAKSAQIAVCQCAEHGPAFGLNCPLPLFQVSASTKLPAMKAMRTNPAVAMILDFAGYFPPPFNPPRA